VSGEDGPRLTFFAYLMVRIYGVTEEHYTKLEKKVREFFKKPAPAFAADFYETLDYASRTDRHKPWLAKELDLLRKYATTAAKQACSPGVAERIVHYAFTQGFWETKLARAYIANILSQDPRNALFLYFQYMHETDRGQQISTIFALKKLREILALAEERNEHLLINLLMKEIRNIEQGQSFEEREDRQGDKSPADPRKIINQFLQGLHEKRKFMQAQKKRKPRKKANVTEKQPSLFDEYLT
jgi:hypothetical protein